MKFSIIYISGKMGTGKTTIANYIAQSYNYMCFAYADKLKTMLLNNGWDGNKDEKGRNLLQTVGKCFRDYDIDIWIKSLSKHLSEIMEYLNFKFCTDKDKNNSINIIITDCRHPNELENFENILKTYIPESEIINSLKIRIVGKDFGHRETNEKISTDISETCLDNYNKFDYTILNDSTKESLFNKIDMILNHHNIKKV